MRANLLKSLFTVPIIVVVGAGQADFVLGLFMLIVLGVSRFILAGLSASMPHVVNGRELITGNALAPPPEPSPWESGIIGVGIRAFAGGGDTGSQVVLVAAIVSFMVASFLAPGWPPTHWTRPWGTGRYVRQRRSRTRPRRADTVGQSSRTQHHGHDHRESVRFRRPHGRRSAVGSREPAPTTDVDAALSDFVLATAGAAVGAFFEQSYTHHDATDRYRSLGGHRDGAGGVVGFGLLTATAINPQLVTLVAGAASIGLAGQSVKVCADTVLQRSIPDDRLGRVFALFDMIVNIALVTGSR